MVIFREAIDVFSFFKKCPTLKQKPSPPPPPPPPPPLFPPPLMPNTKTSLLWTPTNDIRNT